MRKGTCYNYISTLLREFKKFESNITKMFNLSPFQYHVLNILFIEKELSMTEIANELGITKGRMSKIVKALEERGFLIKKISMKKSRRYDFVITEKGEDVIMQVERLLCENEKALFDNNDYKMEQFKSFLDHLIEKLEMLNE